MSQQNESGLKAFTASVALEAFRRVQLVSGSGTSVEYAGADEEFIGVTQASAAADESVTVALRGMGRTFKVECAGAVVVGSVIFGATNGRVDDTASGAPIGSALEVASGAGSIIECVLDALASGSIGGSVGLSDRYALIERFKRAPNLNADLLPASGVDPSNGEWALLAQANRDFEVLGTNAASAQVVPDAGGGVIATTAGAANDQLIITPHLDTNQSAWAATDWLTQKELEWECMVQTGASVINTTFWAGLKLTNTPTVATDNDQAYFVVASVGTALAIHAVSSATGVDDDTTTTLVIPVSTHLLLRISVGADLVPKFYINGALLATGAALTTAVALIPYLGIMETTTTTGKIMYPRWMGLSRKY